MPQEIERRFLVLNMDEGILDRIAAPWAIQQGYFGDFSDSQHMRIRIINSRTAILTKKSGSGISREEENQPLEDILAANFLMANCRYKLYKTRYVIDGWELDIYSWPLGGIIVAEKEMESETESFLIPEWILEAQEVTDSLTNLHLARFASELEQTALENLDVMDEILRMTNRVPTIVLTGGPCSGKSSMMALLKANPLIHCVPEIATILISQVGLKPLSNINRFQSTIYRTQRLFELTSIEQARDEGVRAVVFDRGTVDNAAYLEGGIYEMQKLFATTLTHEYSRYDLVACLEVPPKEIFEKEKSNNPARSETHEEALELQDRIINAWARHPNFRFIKNSGGWEQKVKKVSRLIEQYTKN